MAPTASVASSLAASPHDRVYQAKQLRPKALVLSTLSPPSSDTDSFSSASGEEDTLPSASTTSTLWHAYAHHHDLQRTEVFTSGADAVLRVAGNISESVFVYPLLSDTSSNSSAEDVPTRARVTKLEIRTGAADAVRGALAVGASVSALLPSQTLPLFLPNLFAIAQSQSSAVFHVACETLRQDLATGSSYEAIYALQHAGALLLNSSSPQELHDLAVVAHVAALRLKKLLVHFYDGARVAKERSKLQLLTPAALQTLAALEDHVSPSHGEPHNVAEQVQHVMDDLFPVLQKQYKIYEYYGAQDAECVVVVMGEATAALQEAVAYEQMLGAKVGVLHVRLLLPWSHALFAAALPCTTQRVAVLENMSTGAFAFQRGLLTQNVHVFFHSQAWVRPHTPIIRTGIYGGVFRNYGFSLGMGRAVLAHVSSSHTRRSFVVAKSELLYDHALETARVFPQLDVVYGADYERDGGGDAFTKQYLFWGCDNAHERTASVESDYAATLELLIRNPSTQVHAVGTHSAPTPQRRSISTLEVRVSLAGRSSAVAGLQQGIHEADVTVVTKAELLERCHVAASVKPNGTLLVHTNWKTLDDVDETPLLKQQLAAKHVQLLVVDIDELQKRVDDDMIARVAPQVAFLKAANLFDEHVAFALLARRFEKVQHAPLRAFVSAVWSDVVAIASPHAEWRSYVADERETLDHALLPPLAAIAPSKISHAVVPGAKPRKRSRYVVSIDTQTAWKLVFSDTFASRQRVRDHVTDIVHVTKWQRLTPRDYARNVFHVELDITNTTIQYAIGEALAVFAHNDTTDVLTFLRNVGIDDPETLVTLPVSMKPTAGRTARHDPLDETLTYFQLCSQVLDLFGRPSKKFYEALYARATDAREIETLAHVLDADGKDEYKRRVDETTTFAELLEEFPSARPTLADLVTLVPRIKPRHYSIASSMKQHPTSVHLLVVVHDWTTPSGKYRIGQATNFLKDVQRGQRLSVAVCSSVMKLPTNPQDPIIMAGLGTGMAPFRAFIQERAFLQQQGVAVGPVALYFGARSKAQEFLYGDELEQYERDGLLTHLRCAFSRDQAHKIYIQDRIADDKAMLGDYLLNKNAHFYLCGPTWPVADVREALLAAIMHEGHFDRKQANAYIERMREQGRYVLEVY